MGYALEGAVYVGGTALIASGVYLVLRGNFPAWWRKRFLWPVVNATPRVSHLQGWAAIGLGASTIAIVFSTAAGDIAAGLLVVFALGAYAVAVALFVVSTWLSRRPG